uniref:Uncharacterized protein n=1 Tax=viral metagenome TaxID=1070528 RepID=A0A6M3L510_9ZZZZ
MKSKKEVVEGILKLIGKKHTMGSITYALTKASLKQLSYPDLLNLYEEVLNDGGAE